MVAVPDVSHPLLSHHKRGDLESETFVVSQTPEAPRNVSPALTRRMQGTSGWAPLNEDAHLIPVKLERAMGVSENQRAEVRLTDVARQLTTGGGKPGQGYPCALVPVVYDGYNQKLHRDISPPVRIGKDSGDFVTTVPEDQIPHGPPDMSVGWLPQRVRIHDANGVAPTLASEEGRGQGVPTVAVAFKPSHFTRGKDGAPSDVVPPLTADADKGDQDPIVFCNRTRDGLKMPEISKGGIVPSLTNPGEGGRSDAINVACSMGIRRLTPTECLRLQGFEDFWLDGCDFSDSSKYRMVGNSVAVPVIEFILRRLHAHIAGK